MSASKTNLASSQRWVVPFGDGSSARYRLFCFPHSGAGASMYAAWSRLLPPTIQVCGIQLPGREDRMDEVRVTDVGRVIDQLSAALRSELDREFAFFGNSLGAMLAYELALRFQSVDGSRPLHVFVSARQPPGVTSNDAPVSNLPDADFIREIQHRYGLGSSAFWQNRELVECFLPILRADLLLAESDRFTNDGKIYCPLTVFGGTEDRISEAELRLWQRHAAGSFRLQLFPGGHDYIKGSQKPLTEAIVKSLFGATRP